MQIKNILKLITLTNGNNMLKDRNIKHTYKKIILNKKIISVTTHTYK